MTFASTRTATLVQILPGPAAIRARASGHRPGLALAQSLTLRGRIERLEASFGSRRSLPPTERHDTDRIARRAPFDLVTWTDPVLIGDRVRHRARDLGHVLSLSE